MRTTDDDARVRLYHLDPDSGATVTLMYGSLTQALAEAAAQPEDLQTGLWIQTDNDVVAYLDLIEE